MLNGVRLIVVALGLLMAMSSASAFEVDKVAIDYHKFTLDNGLTVVVHEDHKAPIVAVSVWYHVGSKNEQPGKTGFAHLFEHLMFNGSENYDGEYFKPFNEIGATAMNGTTWFDRTNYFQNVPSTALDLALWMESDRMGHLLGAVTQEKLDNQRGVVQNEKRQGDNRPYGKVEYRVLEGLLPEGHPYRWSTIGSMEDLNNASLDDVHSWFKRFYGAANTVLVLAGDVTLEQAKQKAQQYFGDIPAGPPLHKLQAWVPEKTTNTYEMMHDDVPQQRLYRNWAVPGRTTEEAALLTLAAEILGSGKNSRLYQALVLKRQLATDVSVTLQPHELMSFFEVTVTLAPGADKTEAMQVVDATLARFLERGPQKEELKRTKSRIYASQVRALEEVGGFSGKAATLAKGELYADDPGFYLKQLDWYNKASAQKVQAAAQLWLSKGYYQLDVQPFPSYTAAESGADRSQLPQVTQMPELDFPEVESFVLDNGIKVNLAERTSIPEVDIALTFDAGYAADSTGHKLGTSSFTMDMLNEGTEELDVLELEAELDMLGARLSAGSNLDRSSVFLGALTDKLDASVALMADVVREPRFSEQDLKRIQRQRLARIEQEKSRPVQRALRTLPPLMYGSEHAYGIPFTGSGTRESVQSMTTDDLKQFHQTWLRPSKGEFFVVGDVNKARLQAVLNEHFGDWQEPDRPLVQKNIAQVPKPEQPTIYLVDKPGAPQSLILAGHLTPSSGDSDNLLLDTTNDIFGGQFTARLNMNLREDKGWAYGAYSFFIDAQGQKPWLIYAPVQTDKTLESVQEILNELSQFKGEQPASQEELQEVVNSNTRSLPGKFETASAVLGAFLDSERFDRPLDYPETLKTQYQAMTTQDIQEKARQAFSADALTWVVVGDLEQIREPIEAAGLAEVKVLSDD
ncbi:putative zinc protease [Saliniradius amylolyticus]|uniref:Putative zinc protease n=1 Tax=Saliniradius amylolyticus TaxID=2183582 RepID=A0A2S2E6K4_9ALTE|nr:pitrilysin family protein [Saliniradius amylolyticus]AWL13284.1 putative zinc protease [Saliniradius amylolyticus]